MDRANYFFTINGWSGLCIDALALTKSCISRGISTSTIRARLSPEYDYGDCCNLSVQGKDTGQGILSSTRKGIHTAYRCISRCYTRDQGNPEKIASCILVNFIRNMIAMYKKKEKHAKESDFQSLKLKKSYLRLNEALCDLNQVLHDREHK